MGQKESLRPPDTPRVYQALQENGGIIVRNKMYCGIS